MVYICTICTLIYWPYYTDHVKTYIDKKKNVIILYTRICQYQSICALVDTNANFLKGNLQNFEFRIFYFYCIQDNFFRKSSRFTWIFVLIWLVKSKKQFTRKIWSYIKYNINNVWNVSIIVHKFRVSVNFYHIANTFV